MVPVSGKTTAALNASRSAADKVAKRADALRQLVYDAIADSGELGRTDAELQTQLNLSGNTQRPRRWELWLSGKIKVARDQDGKVRYRRLGPGSKQTIWTSGPEPTCPTCRQVYTKSFTA